MKDMVHYGKPPKNLVHGSDYYIYQWNEEIWYDEENNIYNLDRYPDTMSRTTYGKEWIQTDIPIPKEIKEALLIIKEEICKDIKPDMHFMWYEKCSTIRFIYRDELYRIYPSTFGLDGLIICSDTVFRFEKYHIFERLKDLLGVEQAYYDGMLD